MAVEDTFNGAKTALTLLHAYINTVAQGIGMEQALAMDTMMCEAMGAAQGRMLQAQVGNGEFDAQTAHPLLRSAIEQGFGILSEVIEESPQRVVLKIARCPVFEAAQALGMDAEAIKTSCRASSIPFMAAMAKQLNPNLSYQLVEFRTSADDCCEEAIVLD